jgi:hypothetical protein
MNSHKEKHHRDPVKKSTRKKLIKNLQNQILASLKFAILKIIASLVCGATNRCIIGLVERVGAAEGQKVTVK